MPVLEIADYALAPGVSEAEFLATRPAMEAWLRAQTEMLHSDQSVSAGPTLRL